MAEKEQEHRLEMERKGQTAAISETKRGHWLGFLIAIAAIIGAILSFVLGAHWAVSVAMVGVPILGIVKAIVDRRSDN